MITDPDYGVHDSRVAPEELLIMTVLSRAILDLLGAVGLVSTSEEAQQVRLDALAFLTETRGGWAQRRNDLCDAVGIDGDGMRERVLRVLDGDASALDTYDGHNALTHVTEAREIWKWKKGAPERARKAALETARRRRPPKPKRARNTITKYSEVRLIVLGLLDHPRTFKDLIIATNGDVSDTTIRIVLSNAIAKGEVVNRDNTYVLASVPHTSVAAATG